MAHLSRSILHHMHTYHLGADPNAYIYDDNDTVWTSYSFPAKVTNSLFNSYYVNKSKTSDLPNFRSGSDRYRLYVSLDIFWVCCKNESVIHNGDIEVLYNAFLRSRIEKLTMFDREIPLYFEVCRYQTQVSKFFNRYCAPANIGRSVTHSL